MTDYEDWKMLEKMIDTYKGDDINLMSYPVWYSNDNTLKLYRIKDFENKITFVVKHKGLCLMSVTSVKIDEDDEICFYGKGKGLIAYIERKDW